MRKIGLIAGFAGVCGIALVVFWPRGQEEQAYLPAPVEGAYVQLAFEGSLDTLGALNVSAQSRDGDAVFSPGPTGSAYFAQGDGRYLELATPDLDILSKRIDISFDVKAEKWTNPYEKSAPVKTIAVVSGKSGDRIRHVIFNLSGDDRPALSVSVEDETGSKDRLVSERGALTTDWHRIRLVVDQAEDSTQLYLDGELVAKSAVIPSIVSHGVDRVKIGTWYRQNQAFRGHVDNFVIRDATRETG
ncbi:LamG-like jellyroll fold domain-containing protein [uncultured Roseibium sp.]|uniref:LamG-like jellyroll fold domain-containing protein n=1 Tax=uncultured Roseibium sp. TaxID=1936171 RepID=UPI002636000A|nr:LamG-like jellyroll fold domain-containing protein [uncultured Roseibium sp.]